MKTELMEKVIDGTLIIRQQSRSGKSPTKTSSFYTIDLAEVDRHTPERLKTTFTDIVRRQNSFIYDLKNGAEIFFIGRVFEQQYQVGQFIKFIITNYRVTPKVHLKMNEEDANDFLKTIPTIKFN